jgi:Zn-dependent peptidase ImmA (M78 family)
LRTAAHHWSNESVKRLAGERDPVEAIIHAAREVVLEAIDKGWSGPPYDPFKLAEMRGIAITPRADIPDARTVTLGQSRFLIEYNPTRPPSRMRYSIAHELAHTLFPNCGERIRNRAKVDVGQDDWQLEALCNVAAAEILMPIGSMAAREPDETLSIETVLAARKRFEVSTEAVLIRLVHLSDEPCTAFVASRLSDDKGDQYAYDYLIPSRSWKHGLSPGSALPRSSPVAECTAVGYSAKGRISIPGRQEKLRLECIGIPPYPGKVFPRVAGFLSTETRSISENRIEFLLGDVLSPRGNGRKLIAHVVSDATPNWGGRGVAMALKKKWPAAQDGFRHWVDKAGRRPLGDVHFKEIEPDVEVASMICQKGYGASETPRIRYAAIEKALGLIADRARATGASIHMPRIGCGQAGGSWLLVEELINSVLISAGLSVTIYDMPNSGVSSNALQLSLAPAS